MYMVQFQQYLLDSICFPSVITNQRNTNVCSQISPKVGFIFNIVLVLNFPCLLQIRKSWAEKFPTC